MFILEHSNIARTLTQITTDAVIYRSSINAGNKTQMYSSQITDDPYCIAFDWNGRNIYVGNKVSQTIEIVRTVGEMVGAGRIRSRSSFSTER